MVERGLGLCGGGDVRGGDGAGGEACSGAVSVEQSRGGGARVRGGLRHAHGAAAVDRQLPVRRDVRGARVRGRQQSPDASHLRRRASRRVSGVMFVPTPVLIPSLDGLPSRSVCFRAVYIFVVFHP